MIAHQKNHRPPPDRRLSLYGNDDVSLTYGIHDLKAEFAGLTVAEIKFAFGDILNLGYLVLPFKSVRRM